MAGAQLQQRVVALLLTTLGQDGFALAGANAVREHGLTARPSQDVDLFAFSTLTPEEFADAADRAEHELRRRAYAVVRVRDFPLFVRMSVTDDAGDVVEVDLAVNWRAHEPAKSALGPVLSESDAVAGKLSAVYCRREVRDFLDLDAIRRSGRYSDAELLALGAEHDDGFDPSLFAQSLSTVISFLSSEAAEYGVDAEAFGGVRGRIFAWAVELRDSYGS